MDDLVKKNKHLKQQIQQLKERIAVLEANGTGVVSDEKLQLSEERFRHIIENSKEWIWEINLEGMYTFSSSGICDMLGYKPEEVVNKKYFYEWFCPEIREKLNNDYKKLLKSHEPFKNLEICCTAADGSNVWISTDGIPMYNKKEKLIGYTGSASNITEQKEAEQELLKSNERLSKIFLMSPDCITITRLDNGHIELVNKSFTQLFEYSSDELIGRNVADFDIWVDKEQRESHLSKLRNEGSVENHEIVLRTKSGKSVEGNVSASIIDIDGVSHILSITRNISDKLKIENKIRQNEQLLSLHINQTPLGVIEWGLDYKVNKWNPSAERIFGYTEKEAVGKKADFFVPEINKNIVEEIMGSLKSFSGGERSTNENITKDGSIILCEWYNTPLVNEKGEVIAFASLVQDISARVRAEQIQNVLYNISNAVNTTDSLRRLIELVRSELGKIIDTTNFYVALYNENDDTLSLPFYVDQKDRFSCVPAGKTLTKYVIDNGKSLLADNKVFRELEEQDKIVGIGASAKIWLGVPLKVESKIIGVLAVQSYSDERAFTVTDMQMLEFVSEQIGLSIQRKKAEDELIDALKRAEESDRLKTAFLQNMSHEIRTPMNGILGFTSLLKEPDLKDSEKQYYISIIEKSGERMLNTISDLMDISKIEAGQMDVENVELNVDELIDYVQVFFQPEAERKGLSLRCEKVLGEAIRINSDKEKLYAILTNLVKNAIKYTEKGSVVFGFKREGNAVEFFVKDTGIGIPKEKIDSVFDRFVQVHETLTSDYEGTGLGLSITKAYIELLGGEITLSSRLGEGTTFVFKIPDKVEVKDNAAQQNKIIKYIAKENRQLKILIAEDDETIKKYLSIVVRKMTREVVFANNGEEAVELCQANPDFDLILMDIKMPVMNGYDATKKIRAFNNDVIIVAQTAFAFESERKKAISVGCNDHIAKPINRGALNEMIDKYF